MSLQKIKVELPDGQRRVETGPVQFFYAHDIDWPGVFIRGDNAAHYALHLRQIIASLDPNGKDWLSRGVLNGLLSQLEASRL